MSLIERIRPTLPSAVLYGLLALLSFPTLGLLVFGENGLAYGLDVFDDGGGVPRLLIVARDLASHGPFLWDRYLTAGNALLGQFAISPLAVDTALAVVVGPFAAWLVTGWLMAAVAGISMHLFLRDSLRLPTVAVVVGSVLYLFGSWHYIYGFAILLFPAFLWLADGLGRPSLRRWRWVVAGGLLGAFSLYDGLSQVVVIVAILQLVYLFAVGSRPIGRTLLAWGAMWGLAGVLYAPVLLTQLVMLPISQRTIWDLEYLFGAGIPSAIGQIVRHYTAVVAGVPLDGGFGPGGYRYGTLFLGAVGLPLLVIGVVAGRRDRRSVLLLALLLAIPLLDLAAILATPLQQDLGGFAKSFQLIRVRHLFPFVVTAIAAIGVAEALGPDPAWRRSRWRRAVVGASFVPIVLETIVALAWVARHRAALLQGGAVALGWGLIALALLVGMASVLVIIWSLRRTRGRGFPVPVAMVVAVVVVIAGERALYANGRGLLAGNLATYAEAIRTTPGQAFLLAQPGIGTDRVLTFGDDANRMAAAGLSQVDGYQAIFPLTYHDVFRRLIAPGLESDAAKADYYDKWGARAYAFDPLVDPGLTGLMGARWLYVVGNQVPSVPGIVARWHGGGTTVYEDPGVLPRSFIAGALEVKPTSGDVLEALSAASRDELRARAFASPGAETDGLKASLGADGGRPGPAGSATIVSSSPDVVEIAVRADRPGVLVLTDVMAPGWTAERDGRSAPIGTVDGAFRGVAVDAGTRRVVFRYAPAFTNAGIAVALLASLLILVALGLGLRSERRSRSRDGGTPSATLVSASDDRRHDEEGP